jgi:hypothetical protein
MITARDAGCAANSKLFELRFGPLSNALVDMGDGPPYAADFLYVMASPAPQVTFYVQRQTAGQASTVQLVVMDGCGAWPTFVGAGPAGLQIPPEVPRAR